MLQDSDPPTIRVFSSLKHVRAAGFFRPVAHGLWRPAVVASGESSPLHAVCPLDALFDGVYLRLAGVGASLLLVTGRLSFDSHADDAHVFSATEVLLKSL